MIEKCMNPLKPDCGNTRIAVYIEAGHETYPICSSCWYEITEDGVEWDENGISHINEKYS